LAIDAEDAVELAAFNALNVSSVTSLATVYQHVPEDTDPPVIIIGDMSSDGDFGGKDNSDEQIKLTITAVVRTEERRPLREIKAAVKAVLHRLQVVQSGWTLQFVFSSSDSYLATDDGVTYVGNFNFIVLAIK